MRSRIIQARIKSALNKAGISLENDQFIKPAAPVEQQPTELPYAKIEDDSEETGVTVGPVDIEDLYEELESGLLDMSLNIAATESLELVATISSRNLSNAAMESYVLEAVGAERGTRLLAATTTGGIQCSADIISLEEIATNAAKTGWDNIGKQATSLLSKASELQQVTNAAGTRIVDQFRALKKPAMQYKGGSKVNIATMAGGDRDLSSVIANTKVAIQEDLSGRLSGQLDRAVNDLTKQATSAITQRKGELTSIVASAVKMADTLSSQYKIKDTEFKILGFTRKTLDDQINLPQGIIGAITGNGRKYNFPRYSSNKGGKANPIELTPNVVKDLYAIGVNIGNEIDEQSRIWPQRIEALKSVVELARTAGANIDADRNTWSAEQTAARNVIKMWNANASARKYYINVYNKIASEILQVLNHVTNTTQEASTELFGMGKPKKLKLDEAAAYVRSNLSKFKEGSIDADISLLGEQVQTDAMIKHIDSVLAACAPLVAMAKEPFARVLKAIDAFEEDGDESTMDDIIIRQMTPLIKRLSKPLEVNGYQGYTIKYKNASYGLEGEYQQPTPVVDSVPLTNATLTALLVKADALNALRDQTSKLPWLDYAQEYCDWIYPLIQMLEATRLQILAMGLKAVGSKDQISNEAFGGFFQKKEEAVNKVTVPVYVPDLIKFIKSTDFPGFQDNFTADITAYSDNLKEHIAGMGKAAAEIGRSFNESNLNKYADDVGKLLDICYAQYQAENPNEDDWRAIGNGVLDIFGPELIRSKLACKHFDMQYNNGVYTTRFDYAPNYEVSKGVEYRSIDNRRLSKRLVTGWSKDMALQFFTLWERTDEVSIPDGLDRTRFLREHPRYEDSVSIIALEPFTFVTQRLFEIMDETHAAIRDGIIRK